MGLDTQERRMAAASTARPWMRATFPTGTVDAEERASAGNTYGANPFGSVPAIASASVQYTAPFRVGDYTARPGLADYTAVRGPADYTARPD